MGISGLKRWFVFLPFCCEKCKVSWVLVCRRVGGAGGTGGGRPSGRNFAVVVVVVARE